MGKQLFIAEKPSVAAEFAKALKVNGGRRDGYLESDQYVVTWCVGHLITMSYPEVYDPALKKWSLNTIPFFPNEWKYEVIGSVKKQFAIVKGLLNRADVDTIYICTDSGREGEYIYRLVDQMAGVKNKKRLRVWIDSQTEEEILRGIREAKDWSFYDHLSDSAYLRAKEDYLMGINFSRALTLKFGPAVASFMNTKWSVISVGRVMTCVLGMVVRREREIRSFVKTPFYRVIISLPVAQEENKDWQVIALLSDDSGIPKNAADRLRVFDKIMAKAKEYGISPSRIHIDPLVEMLCTSENGIETNIEVISTVREKYPSIHITAAISNISFNLPVRKLINLGFVVLAMNAGLDSGILDPTNRDMLGLIYATEALLGEDDYCMEYIGAYREGLIGPVKK